MNENSLGVDAKGRALAAWRVYDGLRNDLLFNGFE